MLDEGKSNGVGIWEISGYSVLESKIRAACNEGIEIQSSINSSDISIEEIYIVGSFGDGTGVRQESDLDICISVSGSVPSYSHDFSEALKSIASRVNYREDRILSDFTAFTGVDPLAYPYIEIHTEIQKLCQYESVTTYYNLTEDTKESYV